MEPDIEAHGDLKGIGKYTEGNSRQCFSFAWFRDCVIKAKFIQNRQIGTTDARAETPSEVALELRLRAIKVHFGLTRLHAEEWPGILVFCKRMEDYFKSLTDEHFRVISKILGQQLRKETAECWDWCFAVIEAFRALGKDSPSIENVYEQLIAAAQLSSSSFSRQEKDKALSAIFLVLCWVSMGVKPALSENTTGEGFDTGPSFISAGESAPVNLSQVCRRPTAKLFRGLRPPNETVGDEYPYQSGGGTVHTDALYESSLNYFSLFTIGRVRLKWVDTLTSHLMFDRQTRTLSVFSFPSFCVASILRTRDINTIEEITAELLGAARDDSSSIHREILLTYRLLFGQSSRSRKLLQKLLTQLKKQSREIDPYLFTLCTAPLNHSYFPLNHRRPHLPGYLFPASNLDLDGSLQEADVYSARDDFPVFGTRLLALQRYNLRQQPRRVRDLWRDRRHPLQWHTFWAVVWIGGLTIIMALLQLVVGAAQLYCTIRPSR